VLLSRKDGIKPVFQTCVSLTDFEAINDYSPQNKLKKNAVCASLPFWKETQRASVTQSALRAEVHFSYMKNTPLS